MKVTRLVELRMKNKKLNMRRKKKNQPQRKELKEGSQRKSIKFTNVFFNDLSDLSEFFTETIKEITLEKVKTTCSYNYMSICTFWSGI